MRWTGWIFVATIVIGLAGPAAGGQPGCMGCNRAMTAGPWCVEACATSPGYALMPGCCEEHRRCCDNAWAGYCDHRAQVEAFWARVGTPAAYTRLRPCRMAPMGPCAVGESCTAADPSLQPTPAAPEPALKPSAPEPLEKSGGKSRYYQLR